MKTCNECGQPLFDQNEADPKSELCDACYAVATEEESIEVQMDDNSDDLI